MDSITICVLGLKWDETHLAVLRKLRAYRDQHRLPWQVHGCVPGDKSTMATQCLLGVDEDAPP